MGVTILNNGVIKVTFDLDLTPFINYREPIANFEGYVKTKLRKRLKDALPYGLSDDFCWVGYLKSGTELGVSYSIIFATRPIYSHMKHVVFSELWHEIEGLQQFPQVAPPMIIPESHGHQEAILEAFRPIAYTITQTGFVPDRYRTTDGGKYLPDWPGPDRACIICGITAGTHAWYLRGSTMVYRCTYPHFDNETNGNLWFTDQMTGVRVRIGGNYENEN